MILEISRECAGTEPVGGEGLALGPFLIGLSLPAPFLAGPCLCWPLLVGRSLLVSADREVAELNSCDGVKQTGPEQTARR